MSGHPAVEAAAVALMLGWDPIRYLACEGLERDAADAVLRKAHQLRGEELSRLAEAVGYHCAKALGQMFR